MSDIRLARHNHYTKWKLPHIQPSIYPAESALINRICVKKTPFFIPQPFTFSQNDEYNYHLSFLVEAAELLPLKIDLSFDAIWRAFESLYGKTVTAPKEFKLGDVSPIIAIQADAQSEYSKALDQLLEIIPIQCCKYLSTRIFKDWGIIRSATVPIKTDYEKIWSRLKSHQAQHTNVIALLTCIANKYGAPNIKPEDRRKIATLLRHAIQGTEVDVSGSKFRLPRHERISFIINALLYTFRNDRFHGQIQPPFKSSLGTIQTYTHAHYCFTWAHFLYLFTTALPATGFITPTDAATNAEQNLGVFSDFYGHFIKQ